MRTRDIKKLIARLDREATEHKANALRELHFARVKMLECLDLAIEQITEQRKSARERKWNKRPPRIRQV